MVVDDGELDEEETVKRLLLGLLLVVVIVVLFVLKVSICEYESIRVSRFRLTIV